MELPYDPAIPLLGGKNEIAALKRHMQSHVLSRTICKSQVTQQVKNLTEVCRRPRIHPWVGRIPWRREWLPSAVFLPGESHGQRSLVGYSLWGHKESDTTE